MIFAVIALYLLGGASFWWHLFDVRQVENDPIFSIVATLFWPLAVIVLGSMWIAEKRGYGPHNKN